MKANVKRKIKKRPQVRNINLLEELFQVCDKVANPKTTIDESKVIDIKPTQKSKSSILQSRVKICRAIAKCTNEGCKHISIIDDRWMNDFCSTKCVIDHSEVIFRTWLESKKEDNQLADDSDDFEIIDDHADRKRESIFSSIESWCDTKKITIGNDLRACKEVLDDKKTFEKENDVICLSSEDSLSEVEIIEDEMPK